MPDELGPLADNNIRVHFFDGGDVSLYAWVKAVPRQGDRMEIPASQFRDDLFEVAEVIWPLLPTVSRQARVGTVRVRLRRSGDAR
jgi:hypothetical protein